MTGTTATTTEVLSAANGLLSFHAALIHSVRAAEQQHRRQLRCLTPPPQILLSLSLMSTPPRSPTPSDDNNRRSFSPLELEWVDLPPSKRARARRYRNYVPEEETIRNDYSQRYVDTGEWPQNWVLGADPEQRFDEYPKQQRLLNLKKVAVSENSLPPLYLPYSKLHSLHPSKFDVILLDPPFSSSFSWDHLQDFSIPNLAADPSFIFLWVGSGAGEGLERGREILAKWGYRRCEDVVWVKTNKTTNEGPGTDPPTTSLMTRTKQHCLIGIRGTVRRSTDSWFVHCNVDTDVIFWEGDQSDPMRKPPEMYSLIENFCLGFRRLEIFGRISSLRRGWVTVMAPDQTDRLIASADSLGTVHIEGEDGFSGMARNWVGEIWEDGVKQLTSVGKTVVPMTPEIEALRPKSPLRSNHNFIAVGASAGQSGASGTASRFPPANQGVAGIIGVGMQAAPTHSAMGQNQMLAMGMGINSSLGIAAPAGGVGMGNFGMGLEDMMCPWNPMIAAAGVGGMSGMSGIGGLGVPGIGNMAMAAAAANMTINQMLNQSAHAGIQMMGPMGLIGSTPGGTHFANENGWDPADPVTSGMIDMCQGMSGMDMISFNDFNNGRMGMEQWPPGSAPF